MAITKTSFRKGQGGRKPGRKNKTTILKETIGIAGWNGLKAFTEGEGVDKLIREIKKLRGKSYVIAYTSIAEYVRPKLTRVEAKVETTPKADLSNLSIEELKQLLAMQKKIQTKDKL